MCSLHYISSWCDIVTLAIFCAYQRTAVQISSVPLLLFTYAKFHGINTSCSKVTLAGNSAISCFYRQNIYSGEKGGDGVHGALWQRTSVLSWSV